MNETREIFLTPDSFLGSLGLSSLEHRLGEPEQRDLLFRLTVDFLKDHVPSAHPPKIDTAINELPLKVPGTSIVVRLGKYEKDELGILLSLALYVAGTDSIDVKSVTVAGLVALSRRVGRLRKEYGERSIFDALGEVNRPTIRDVTLALYGKPCRYPKADCRFRNHDGEECTILKDQVEKTVEDLAARRILRRRNAVEPYEYSAVI